MKDPESLTIDFTPGAGKDDLNPDEVFAGLFDQDHGESVHDKKWREIRNKFKEPGGDDPPTTGKTQAQLNAAWEANQDKLKADVLKRDADERARREAAERTRKLKAALEEKKARLAKQKGEPYTGEDPTRLDAAQKAKQDAYVHKRHQKQDMRRYRDQFPNKAGARALPAGTEVPAVTLRTAAQPPEPQGDPDGYVVDTLAGMTKFQQYMHLQHGRDVNPLIRQQDYPNMAFTASGKLALYGDDELEKRLNLPPNIRAAQTQNGVIHQVFDASLVMPKFVGMHDVSEPHQESVMVH